MAAMSEIFKEMWAFLNRERIEREKQQQARDRHDQKMRELAMKYEQEKAREQAEYDRWVARQQAITAARLGAFDLEMLGYNQHAATYIAIQKELETKEYSTAEYLARAEELRGFVEDTHAHEQRAVSAQALEIHPSARVQEYERDEMENELKPKPAEVEDVRQLICETINASRSR